MRYNNNSTTKIKLFAFLSGGAFCKLYFTTVAFCLTVVMPNVVLAQQHKVVIPYGTEFWNGSSPTDPSKPDEGYFNEGTTVYFRVKDSKLNNVIMNSDNLSDFFAPAEDYLWITELQSWAFRYTVGNRDCTIDSYYPVTFNDDKAQEGRDPITWYLSERTKYVKNNTLIPEDYIISPIISTDWRHMKFELEGWYTTDTYEEGTEWDFATDKVTGVVNLYPKWVPHKYIIVAEPSEVIQFKSSSMPDVVIKQMIKTYIVDLNTKDTICPGYDLGHELSDNVYWHMAQLANGKPYHTNVIYSTDGNDGWVKLHSDEFICEDVEVKVTVISVDAVEASVGGETYSAENVCHKFPKLTINIPKTNPVESFPIKFVVNRWYNYFPEEGSTSFTYQFTKGVDECEIGENTISVSVPYYDDQNSNFRYFYRTVGKFTFNIQPYKVSFANIANSFDVDAYEDEKIQKPVDPTKEGYAFDGWYTQDGKKWDFENGKVTGNTELSAKWIELKQISVSLPEKLTFPIDTAKFCKNEEKTVSLQYEVTSSYQPTKYTITFDNPVFQDIMSEGEISSPIIISIPEGVEPGDYKGTIVFEGDETMIPSTTNFTISVAGVFKDVIMQLYENVIFVNNHEKKFSSYQWFHNGVPVNDSYATRQFYTEKTLSGKYFALMNSGTMITCEWSPNPIVKKAVQSVKAYPNPVSADCGFSVEIENYDEAKTYKISVVNSNGVQVMNISAGSPKTELTLPHGVYSILLFANGEKCGWSKMVVE